MATLNSSLSTHNHPWRCLSSMSSWWSFCRRTSLQKISPQTSETCICWSIRKTLSECISTADNTGMLRHGRRGNGGIGWIMRNWRRRVVNIRGLRLPDSPTPDGHMLASRIVFVFVVGMS
ncbi:hypothetical protein BD410DRAFT_117052 [Rickenella mellea]|uniref:Uncharacterized protein n=1 Tax=Rickenella mellea TaxID=50990 RepID=A0A4Y7QB56_9AGAM|nr:hypothetical protein BD410DRAFT_117052 [Rickenella mellea]